MMTDYSIAQLESMLRKARQREADAKDIKKAETPIIWQFTIELNDDKWDTLWDKDSCFYKIRGRVLNEEEAKAVGHHVGFTGDMKYVYNMLNHKIVCAVGGGTSFINGGHNGEDASARQAFDELNEFLIENPEGGDITHIVNAHKQRMGYGV